MSFSEQYDLFSVEGYYEKHAETYSNPHEESIAWLLLNAPVHGKVLDLACGSGEVTNAIEWKCDEVEGMDPYTGPAYKNRTGQDVIPFSFEDIMDGAIEHYEYDAIVCSYAMHLLEESKLPLLLYRLSQVSERLIIVTPHKRPQIKAYWKEDYRETLPGGGPTLISYKRIEN